MEAVKARNGEIAKIETERRTNERDAIEFQNENLCKFLLPLGFDGRAMEDRLRNPVVEAAPVEGGENKDTEK